MMDQGFSSGTGQISPRPHGNDGGEAVRCLACATPLKTGDRYYPDASGGFLHEKCCGPERESYTLNDEPLGPEDAIPEPYIWGAQ